MNRVGGLFPGTSTNLSSQTITSRQNPSGTGVYVSNCLFTLRQEVMAALCIALLDICLLSHPLSSLAIQAVIWEEPFTSTTYTLVNVFCIQYVDMIVAHWVNRMVSFLT